MIEGILGNKGPAKDVTSAIAVQAQPVPVAATTPGVLPQTAMVDRGGSRTNTVDRGCRPLWSTAMVCLTDKFPTKLKETHQPEIFHPATCMLTCGGLLSLA